MVELELLKRENNNTMLRRTQWWNRLDWYAVVLHVELYARPHLCVRLTNRSRQVTTQFVAICDFELYRDCSHEKIVSF